MNPRDSSKLQHFEMLCATYEDNQISGYQDGCGWQYFSAHKEENVPSVACCINWYAVAVHNNRSIYSLL